MHITSTRGCSKIAHEGRTYEPVQGFVFEVPQHLGEHLLGMSDEYGPQWRLPEQDDYDLPEPIAHPTGEKPAKKTTPRPSKRPAVNGKPPVTGE